MALGRLTTSCNRYCPQIDRLLRGSLGTRPSARPQNCVNPRLSDVPQDSMMRDAEISRRVGIRRRDCWTSGDRAACGYGTEKSGSAAYVEFKACASLSAGLWELPLQSHRLAWVQPSCAGLLVDRAARARRQGKARFLQVGNIFDVATTLTNWKPSADSYLLAGCREYSSMHREARLTEENRKAVCACVKQETIGAR
jgi:hypothetical protein